MRAFLLAFFLLFGVSGGVWAQESVENAGFVQNAIWFSKDPFFAGDTVRLYTAVFNSTPHDLRGQVQFLVDGVSVGTAEFTATSGGGAGIVWTDWTAQKGDHSFSAAITQAQLSVVGKGEQAVALSQGNVEGPTRQVDLDTDRDGIGDREDDDRDGDGLSNATEEKLGTNPLVADTDGDGISDQEDVNPLVAQSKEEEQEGELALLSPDQFSGALEKVRKNGGDLVLAAGQGLKGRLEGIFQDQYEALEGGRAYYSQQIAEGKVDGDADFRELVGEYAALAAVSFGAFAFDNPLFLYILILLVLTKLVRLGWNRMFAG